MAFRNSRAVSLVIPTSSGNASKLIAGAVSCFIALLVSKWVRRVSRCLPASTSGLRLDILSCSLPSFAFCTPVWSSVAGGVCFFESPSNFSRTEARSRWLTVILEKGLLPRLESSFRIAEVPSMARVELCIFASFREGGVEEGRATKPPFLWSFAVVIPATLLN